eukprot:scaffold2406_cov363-Prasinococcus_capsulatus_cf.AAC.2
MATVPMPRSTGALAALALHVLLALLALAVAADDALVGHVASGTATAALVSGAQGRWVEASRWALFRDKTVRHPASYTSIARASVYELEGGAHTLVVEKPPDHADSQPLSLAAWAAQLRAQPTAVAGLPPPLLASVSDAPSQAAPGPHAWARRALAQGVGATPARGARPPHAGGEDEEPYPLPDAEWRFIPEYEGALLPGSSLSWTANSFRDSACFPAMSADASELQPGAAWRPAQRVRAGGLTAVLRRGARRRRARQQHAGGDLPPARRHVAAVRGPVPAGDAHQLARAAPAASAAARRPRAHVARPVGRGGRGAGRQRRARVPFPGRRHGPAQRRLRDGAAVRRRGYRRRVGRRRAGQRAVLARLHAVQPHSPRRQPRVHRARGRGAAGARATGRPRWATDSRLSPPCRCTAATCSAWCGWTALTR